MRICCGAILSVVIVAFSYNVYAQSRKVSRSLVSCSEPRSLHAALLEHDKVRIEFRYKMQTGYRRRAKRGDITAAGSRNRFLYAGPGPTLKAISKHLTALDRGGKTAALIFQPGNGRCVWLVGPRGIEASGQLKSSDRLAHLFRNKLGVTVRSASRVPRKRGKKRGLSTVASTLPDAEAGAIKGLTRHILPENIGAKIKASFDTLLILPSRDLSAVPFAALSVGQKGEPLIASAVPIVLPSVDGLFFWVKAPKNFTAGTKLIVGDPDLSEDPVWDFIPLPGAREEALFVANAFRARALIGQEATFDSVQSALRKFHISMIYFATHGISDARNPMDGSFLALKGTNLTGSKIKKIASYPSNHPIVVMSACQSGLGKTFESGIFGLARAWIYAGASQVVASLWNVDDKATAFLMKQFVSSLRKTKNAQSALRRAILKSKEKYADPALWGGFTLFGYPQPKEQ